jgi:ATP-dependent RNA helicase DDX27
MEAQKATHLIEHEKEIFSRPARTWFQTTKEKEEMKSRVKEEFEDRQNGGGAKRRQPTKNEKDQPKQKKQKISRIKRREQKLEKQSEEKHGEAPKCNY